MDKTFIIKYEIHFFNTPTMFNKEIKVKNCMSDLHSKIKLETWIKSKHSDFQFLVINSCKEEDLGVFGDIFKDGTFNNIFGNLFGGKK